MVSTNAIREFIPLFPNLKQDIFHKDTRHGATYGMAKSQEICDQVVDFIES